MTSEQFVKTRYPLAEILQKPFLGRAEYAVFISDICSRRHDSNILGRGMTRSKAWVSAKKAIIKLEANPVAKRMEER